ncbi:helix-turn-helix domain-containing protein [Macrococcus bovicus]|uniref:XRE family transcriptional regulator n=1 Tax=Macrococcus bovicus TaxID=69968 RepID=A0A4R6BXT9_9STAP|nr:helix-turn-helix transcriptional regulator [Macrococcus bovicus]TDM13323.1 XRE family transcriptional regulator [Macrococcus bovicus]
MDKKEVGKSIRTIRENLGLTMAQFGEKIDGVKSGVVSNWENGKQLPNKKRLKIIADIGGISVEDLLYSNERFKDRFKRLRNQSKLTASELSTLLDIDEKEIDYIENNMLPFIKNDLINSAAEIFGVPSSYLLGVDNNFFQIDENIENYLKDYFFIHRRKELFASYISDEDILKAYFQSLKLAALYQPYLLNNNSYDGKTLNEKLDSLCKEATASVITNEDYTNIGSINKTISSLENLLGELEAYFYDGRHVSKESLIVYNLRENADEKLYNDLKSIINESISKVNLIKKYYKE